MGEFSLTVYGKDYTINSYKKKMLKSLCLTHTPVSVTLKIGQGYSN